MRRFKAIKKNSKNTIIKKLIIVFFCIILITILIFNIYAKTILKKTNMLVNDKVDTIIYDLFNYLITDDVFKDNNNELIKIEKNRNDEIVAVNYDIEKTYKSETPYIGLFFKNNMILTNKSVKGSIEPNWFNPYENITTWCK